MSFEQEGLTDPPVERQDVREAFSEERDRLVAALSGVENGHPAARAAARESLNTMLELLNRLPAETDQAE